MFDSKTPLLKECPEPQKDTPSPCYKHCLMKMVVSDLYTGMDLDKAMSQRFPIYEFGSWGHEKHMREIKPRQYRVEVICHPRTKFGYKYSLVIWNSENQLNPIVETIIYDFTNPVKEEEIVNAYRKRAAYLYLHYQTEDIEMRDKKLQEKCIQSKKMCGNCERCKSICELICESLFWLMMLTGLWIMVIFTLIASYDSSNVFFQQGRYAEERSEIALMMLTSIVYIPCLIIFTIFKIWLFF